MSAHVPRSVIICAIAGIATSMTAAPGEPQCVAQDAYDHGQGVGGYGVGSYVLAQSFIPSRPYVLDAVEILLDPDRPGETTAYIQDDATAYPGVIYAQATISTSEPGWQHVDLPDTDVMSGFVYYIRLEGGPALWSFAYSDPYLAGEGFRNGAPQAYDHFFRTCSPDEPRCVVEESYDPQAWAGWLGASQYVLAQSFTPSSSFTLDGVEALLRLDSPADLTAYIQDDPSSLPGVIHAQTTASFPGPGFLYFDLPPIVLSAGTTYYIRIWGAASWYYGEQPPYPGGAAFVDNQLTADDFLFRVCGEPAPVEENSWGTIKATYR